LIKIKLNGTLRVAVTSGGWELASDQVKSDNGRGGSPSDLLGFEKKLRGTCQEEQPPKKRQ
jgi:hypothetical protein